MTKENIIYGINVKIQGLGYSSWTIGITDNPVTRKAQHENEGRNVKRWQNWKTDSEEDGRQIEKYFLNKGMQGDTGGGGKAGYIYIF